MEYNIPASSIRNYYHQWKNAIIPWSKNSLQSSELFKNGDIILMEHQKKPSFGLTTTTLSIGPTQPNYHDE